MANTLIAKTSLRFYKDECQRYACDKTSPVSGIKKFIDAATIDMLGLVYDLNGSTLFNRDFQLYTETLIQVIKESKKIAANEDNRESFLNMLSKIDLAASSALANMCDIERVDRFEKAEAELRKLVFNTSWKVSKMYDVLIGPLTEFYSNFSYLKAHNVINAPFMVVDVGVPDSKNNQIKFSKENLQALYDMGIVVANGYDLMKESNMDDYKELLTLINKYIGPGADCNTCGCYDCPYNPKKFPEFEDDDTSTSGKPHICCPGHYHYEADPACNRFWHSGCSPITPSTPTTPPKPTTPPPTWGNCGCVCPPHKPPLIDDSDDNDGGLGSFSCSTRK